MKKWIVTITYSFSTREFTACVPVVARDYTESHEKAKELLKEQVGKHFHVDHIISFQNGVETFI